MKCKVKKKLYHYSNIVCLVQLLQTHKTVITGKIRVRLWTPNPGDPWYLCSLLQWVLGHWFGE